MVLNQSDLLIVVWDGQNRAGDGSTVDTAQEAIRFRVPVLWIDALALGSFSLGYRFFAFLKHGFAEVL